MELSAKATLLICALAGLLLVAAQGADTLQDATRRGLDADTGYLEALYKHLHAHPELSYQETNTARRVAAELRQAGFDVTEGVGGHGVVGVLRNGAGPTLMVRTDLDALPVAEQTGLAYASKARARDDKGNDVSVMHACGHDMHMTVFTGASRRLQALKATWRGTLVMIGQPAEERGGGARAMLKDGLFERFPKPDHAIALHVDAGLPAGSVGWVEGYALASSDGLNLTIRGVGGHGAWPHTTKDPVVLAAQTVLALQTIVSRELEPIAPAVVTVGSIHGGTKHNIIPDEVRLQLTVRAYSDDVRDHTIEAVARIARGLAQSAGVPESLMPTLTFEDERIASTYNDPALTRRLAKVFETWLGKERVVGVKPVMGGEDFGLYGRTEAKIPICIFWLGTVSREQHEAAQAGKVKLPSLHSSGFYPVIQPTIQAGVTAMTAAALELLGSP
jgi:hippurate hydrolase